MHTDEDGGPGSRGREHERGVALLDESSGSPDATDDDSLLRREVVHTGNEVAVTLTGEADLASAPALLRHCQELLGLPITSLTLDLAGVSCIDSSGVAALIETRRCAKEQDVALVLASLPAQARQVLEVTGVIDMFDVRGDAGAS